MSIDKLEDMIGYDYQLWDYQVSHSTLTIRAVLPKGGKHNVHLTFSDVYFIQAPSSWSDGDIRVASDDEFWRIARQLGWTDREIPLRKLFILYSANTSKGRVYIMGKLAPIENDVEPIYDVVTIQRSPNT